MTNAALIRKIYVRLCFGEKVRSFLNIFMQKNKNRRPVSFAPPDKKRRKWERIIDAFMRGDMALLRKIQRTGARGRILQVLVRQCFDAMDVGYEQEPIFEHVAPLSWYVDFAEKNGLMMRTHDHYNPDFILDDGTWVEITLSENTAFRKVFRYGHQAPTLLVLWLDEDTGLHKTICEKVDFLNAAVKPVSIYYDGLEQTKAGAKIKKHLEFLKQHKRDIM